MKRRKDGRYCKSVTINGVRKYVYADSERGLTKKLIEMEMNSGAERHFEDVADDWWSDNYDRFSPQTIRVYKPAYNRAIYYLKGKRIGNIIAKDIYIIVRAMIAQGFSKKTIHNQLTVCSQIFKHAMITGEAMYNPCFGITLPANTKNGVKREAASESDEAKVRRSADIWLLPYFILHTGLRKGEALALQWKDVDLEKRMLSVSKSVYYEGDRPYIKKPKTENSARRVPIVKPLLDILSPLVGQPKEYIFSDNGGKTPLTAKRYATRLKHFHEETGTSFTAHQLRHSFATIAAENGIPAKTVQEILGHKQISLTLDTYTSFRDVSLATAAVALDDIFQD